MRISLMKTIRFVTLWIILIFYLLVPHIRAQDTTGFIDSVSHAYAFNERVEWQESWFSGLWYNFSFTDNFSFTYKYYAYLYYRPSEELIEFGAFSAAMGILNTSFHGPRFCLIGYVVEDSTWCIIPAVLSPEYIHEMVMGDDVYCWVEGIWYSWREFWDRDPLTYLFEETYVEHSFTIWGRLPPHKTVQVWWGADAFLGFNYYRENNLITVRDLAVKPAIEGDTLTWYDTLDDYMDSGSGLWCDLGEFYSGGPEPPPNEEPPGWAECTFDGWFKSDRTDGKDWLPEPGSEIGLAFKFERTEVPATVTIRYNVYNISTWQGECMNYPVDAPIPRATGDGKFFDFTVVDTAKYDIDIYDFDTYNGLRLDFIPENPTNVASTRRYVLSLELDFGAETVIYDTLWLKAHDYGAKAIVSPSTGQTWRDMMKMRTTAFGQDVWSVSVPRDDDGQAFIGYNWGDFVADAWEEKLLGLASEANDSAIVRFVPFYQLDAGNIVYADRDSIPKGRDIRGDGFCNWEEYRGFITVGDQFGFDTSSVGKKHKRLNSFTKNALVHFMPNAECRPEAPGWMNALPDTMAYLVDHLTQLEDSDTTRLSLRRWVNINKYGAYFPYYSARSSWGNGLNWGTTNYPASMTNQNAVVFWSIYRGDHPKLKPYRRDLFGYVKTPRVFSPDMATVPKYTRQVVVNTDYIDLYTANLPYYRDHFDDYLQDVDKMKYLIIPHEFGHTIGMPHDPVFQYIMAKYPLKDSANQYRWILDPPLFTRQYSDGSKSKISILMEER